MQVVVDELITNYSQTGTSKKTLLLLHGWADSCATFSGLSKQFEQYSLVMLDLPGFGKTAAPKKAWGLHEYAEFVAHFLLKINCQPYAIVGHSNGGAIAIQGLANGILSADKLVLLASAGIRSDTAKKQVLRFAVKPAKLALKLAPKSVQKKVKTNLYDAIGSDYLVAEHMQETFKKVVGHDVLGDAKQLKLPTLLIYGQNDIATPPAYGEQLQNAIKGSRLHIIPETGHFLHHEQVYKVASLTEGFLK